MTFFFISAGFTLTPIIITSSNQIEFRYIFASSWLFFCVFMFFFFELIPKYRSNLGSIKKFTILLILLIGTLTVNLNFERQFLSPYKSKVEFLKISLLNCNMSGKNLRSILIVPPKKVFPVRNNIGMYSQVTDLASTWVPVPSVENVLVSLDFDFSKVTLLDNRNPSDVKSCQIDLEEYRQILLRVNF
jgi:hypothetical protein